MVLVARGAQYTALREGGLRFRGPDGERTRRLPVVEGPDVLGALRTDDVPVPAVKTRDSAAALDVWGPWAVTRGAAVPPGSPSRAAPARSRPTTAELVRLADEAVEAAGGSAGEVDH